MTKHKLVLIFDEDSEVNNYDRVLVYSNILDATHDLTQSGVISNLKIEPDDRFFSFNTTSWQGTGKAYWAVDKS